MTKEVPGVPAELLGDPEPQQPPSLNRLLRIASGLPDPGPEQDEPTDQDLNEAIRRLAKPGA